MKVTAIKAQVKNKDRVSVFIDGSYRFSLDITQVAELGIRSGKEYTEEELVNLENESQFGKVYTRSLEYALTRPRSLKEMRDYFYRKTRDTRTQSGEIKKGVSVEVTQRALDRLVGRGYVDDIKFAAFWVENRNVRKGSSTRRLQAELMAKGVDRAIIEQTLSQTDRNDSDELGKVIARKAARYETEDKLIAYLQRQGFSYSNIREALDSIKNPEDDS